jgi:hypothetical protein
MRAALLKSDRARAAVGSVEGSIRSDRVTIAIDFNDDGFD